jgi:hypothetical protein
VPANTFLMQPEAASAAAIAGASPFSPSRLLQVADITSVMEMAAQAAVENAVMSSVLKLQGGFRARQARRRADELRRQREAAERARRLQEAKEARERAARERLRRQQAAIKIQAASRGRAARRRVDALRKQRDEEARRRAEAERLRREREAMRLRMLAERSPPVDDVPMPTPRGLRRLRELEAKVLELVAEKHLEVTKWEERVRLSSPRHSPSPACKSATTAATEATTTVSQQTSGSGAKAPAASPAQGPSSCAAGSPALGSLMPPPPPPPPPTAARSSACSPHLAAAASSSFRSPPPRSPSFTTAPPSSGGKVYRPWPLSTTRGRGGDAGLLAPAASPGLTPPRSSSSVSVSRMSHPSTPLPVGRALTRAHTSLPALRRDSPLADGAEAMADPMGGRGLASRWLTVKSAEDVIADDRKQFEEHERASAQHVREKARKESQRLLAARSRERMAVKTLMHVESMLLEVMAGDDLAGSSPSPARASTAAHAGPRPSPLKKGRSADGGAATGGAWLATASPIPVSSSHSSPAARKPPSPGVLGGDAMGDALELPILSPSPQRQSPYSATLGVLPLARNALGVSLTRCAGPLSIT